MAPPPPWWSKMELKNPSTIANLRDRQDVGAAVLPITFQILDTDPGWCNNSRTEEDEQEQQYTGLEGWDII